MFEILTNCYLTMSLILNNWALFNTQDIVALGMTDIVSGTLNKKKINKKYLHHPQCWVEDFDY